MDKRKKIITLIVAGALALTAVVGAFTYRSVYAQSATPTPATPGTNQAAPAQPGQAFRGGQPGGPRGGGYTDAQLATALGITTDQLTAAYQSATSEALKEAVSKGLITQAQADQITANGGNFDHGLRFLGPNSGIDYNALLAKALNITTDQLSAARLKASNAALDAAVAAGTMTQAQADLIKAREALANNAKFQSSMQSAYEAAVKQAVTDGVITQAQADAIIQAQSQNGGGFFGPGFDGGFGHGRGGHGGPGFGGFPGGTQNNQNNQVPTTSPSSSGL